LAFGHVGANALRRARDTSSGTFESAWRVKLDWNAKFDGVDSNIMSADETSEGDDSFVFPRQFCVESIKRTIYIVRGQAITLPFIPSLADEHPEADESAPPAPGIADAA